MPSPYIEASKHPEGTKAVEDHFNVNPILAPLVAPLYPFYGMYELATGKATTAPPAPWKGKEGPI